MAKKFDTGKTVMTRGVAEKAAEDGAFAGFILSSFTRYLDGDWGDVCADDAALNDESVEEGERIMAAYIPEGRPELKIWIVTEWDRSTTTVLFPDEY